MNILKSSLGLIIIVILFGLAWWLIGENIVKKDNEYRDEPKVISSLIILKSDKLNELEAFYKDTLQLGVLKEDSVLIVNKVGIKFVKSNETSDTSIIELSILNWNQYYKGLKKIKPEIFKSKYIEPEIKLFDPAGNRLTIKKY